MTIRGCYGSENISKAGPAIIKGQGLLKVAMPTGERR